MAKPNGVSGSEHYPPPMLPSLNQTVRSAKTSTKSERRRSLPAQAPLPASTDAHELAKLPEELAHLAFKTNLCENRRPSNSVMSSASTISSARSTHSDRGHSDRGGRERGGDRRASNAEDTLSIHRLRSNSGLSLHTNSAALRRYTDYNADGSTRLPTTDEGFAPDSHHGEASDDVSGTPTTPKLLSWEMVSAILDDPVARQRLIDYTRLYGGTENLDFLEQVRPLFFFLRIKYLLVPVPCLAK